MKRIFGIGLLVCVSGIFSTGLCAQEDGLQFFEGAIPIVRALPEYPLQAVDGDVPYEGKVTVNYMVDTQGNVFEPVVVESYGHRSFDTAALRAISRFKFEPATLEGQAVESAGFTRLVFSLSDAHVVREQFGYDYQRVMDSLSETDQERSKRLLDSLEIDEPVNHIEYAYLHFAKYRFTELYGSISEQQTYLSEALIVDFDGNYILEESLVLPLKQKLFVLSVMTKHYLDAVSLFEDIASSGDREFINKFSSAYQQLLGVREDESSYARAEDLGKSGVQNLGLFKSGFYMDNVVGDIAELKLRCQAKYQFFAFDPELTYQIPDSFGECRIQVIGDPGSTYDFVQF